LTCTQLIEGEVRARLRRDFSITLPRFDLMAQLERNLGARHPKVAQTQADLAGLLDRLSRSAEARPLFETAIATQRAVLGAHHPSLAETLFSYGLLLLGQHENAAGDAALHEALEIFGPDRYESGYCLRYLGLSAMDQDRYQEAAELFTRAAMKLESTLGPDDSDRWRTLANLGWAHLKLGQVPLARRELGAAVAKLEKLTGPESYELRLPLKELGETLTAAGATTEAIATLERVDRLEAKLFGTRQHCEVALSDLLLAQAWRTQGGTGGLQAAHRSLDEARTIASQVCPREVTYGLVLLEGGRLALIEGDRASARRDLETAEPILRAHVSPRHSKLRELRRLLARAGQRDPSVSSGSARNL